MEKKQKRGQNMTYLGMEGHFGSHLNLPRLPPWEPVMERVLLFHRRDRQEEQRSKPSFESTERYILVAS